MQVSMLSPTPKPHPGWTNIGLGRVQVHTSVLGGGSAVHDIVSIGSTGRAEGYDSVANASRAARNLSRGERDGAVAVIEYEGRSYLQKVELANHFNRDYGVLRFEASYPARVGTWGWTLREGTVASRALAGLVSVVDGSRTLRVA